MSNPFTSYSQGKSYRRQSQANMHLRQLADNHPASYGWEDIGVNKENGLVIWQKGDNLLQRHPAGDCWLLYHVGVWQPIDKHVSELTAELETIRLSIELEIAKEQFAADIERLAA